MGLPEVLGQTDPVFCPLPPPPPSLPSPQELLTELSFSWRKARKAAGSGGGGVVQGEDTIPGQKQQLERGPAVSLQ